MRWERFPRNRIQKKSRVSDPSLHHGTCVTHVPWCMSGSLTRGGGENVPGIPGACAILQICQEAHCLHSTPRVEAPVPLSSWYCLKCWFGADRQQAITRINAAKILMRLQESMGYKTNRSAGHHVVCSDDSIKILSTVQDKYNQYKLQSVSLFIEFVFAHATVAKTHTNLRLLYMHTKYRSSLYSSSNMEPWTFSDIGHWWHSQAIVNVCCIIICNVHVYLDVCEYIYYIIRFQTPIACLHNEICSFSCYHMIYNHGRCWQWNGCAWWFIVYMYLNMWRMHRCFVIRCHV